MILAHINPNALLAGKILGFGGFGVLTIADMGVGRSAQLPYTWTSCPVIRTADGRHGLIHWAVIGYGQYATLFAAMASRASRTAEMNQATMPVTLIVMVGYMGSILASTQPVGILVTILHVTAFVPFLAPIMAFAMVQSGGLPWWQVLLDVLLQLAVLWWALSYAANIFRRHLLTYHPRNIEETTSSETGTLARINFFPNRKIREGLDTTFSARSGEEIRGDIPPLPRESNCVSR